MILKTKERVDLIMTIDRARGLEEALMELNSMIIHEQNPNMKKVLQVAYGEINKSNDAAWKEVYRLAEVYLNPPYVEAKIIER